jgi:RNA-directed DNA polymerase
MTLEPRDKLDTTTNDEAATVAGNDGAGVNGPEGAALDWDAVDWQTVEADVRRLRRRIFAATRAGDLKQVRNLQKLMLRSRANTLVSVRRVTQRNTATGSPRSTKTTAASAASSP